MSDSKKTLNNIVSDLTNPIKKHKGFAIWVGFLLAVHTVQEKTGRVIDLMEFMAQFITGLVSGAAHTTSSRITEETTPEELPSAFVGTTHHADPEEARENFAIGMGDLFADDGENIWDD